MGPARRSHPGPPLTANADPADRPTGRGTTTGTTCIARKPVTRVVADDLSGAISDGGTLSDTTKIGSGTHGVFARVAQGRLDPRFQCAPGSLEVGHRRRRHELSFSEGDCTGCQKSSALGRYLLVETAGATSPPTVEGPACAYGVERLRTARRGGRAGSCRVGGGRAG